MSEHVLITGGAGFIGSHLADRLLRCGYRVRVLDNLSPQVHGPGQQRPAYLAPEVELVVGDVRDRDAVRRALDGIDAVYHLAAAVGVGQSMYEVADYTSINNLGTAVLLEALIERPVRRLVVASSMSLYGEGLYRRADGTIAQGVERTLDQLRAGQWELRTETGAPLVPIPTPETKAPALASVYALSKYDQERMCLMIGRAYGIETVALRFFNVFGTRQALSNPYTGVLAIFASRLLNGNPPRIFEDGLQRRDFVSVYDIAQACELALTVPAAAGEVFNVGSGRSYDIREVAQKIAAAVGRPEIQPEITAEYRVGDIRHCFADISRARAVIGYQPTVDLEQGLVELASWLQGQQAEDRVAEASAELAARGLTLPARTAGANGSTPARAAASDGAAPAQPASSTGGTAAGAVRSRPAERVAVVTGGAGFIGSNLADRLLARGERVRIFDNLSRPGVRRNVEWLQARHGARVELVAGDVRNLSAVRAAVADASSVFHLAAQVAVTTSLDDPRTDFDVNALGTLNVLEAIREADAPPPLLYTSTNKVYGSLPDVALARNGKRYEPAAEAIRASGIGEARPLDFHSPYGCSKGTADQYVRDYARSFGLPTVVFRMSCIYGPRQFGTEDQGWIAHFLIRALRGEPLVLYGDGMQVRDALYVDDLVDAMLLAREQIDRTQGHAFNIGGGPARTTSLLELLDRIEQIAGRRPDVRYADWRTGDQQYYVTDTRRFSETTGWSPRVELADGIALLHAWLVESGAANTDWLAAAPAAAEPVAIADLAPPAAEVPIPLVMLADDASTTSAAEASA